MVASGCPRPQINSLNTELDELAIALQTVFRADGDTTAFLAETTERIQERERAMLATCSRNRLRIDDNVYELLESRDAVSERSLELKDATREAADVSDAVEDAAKALEERMRIRKNLEAALAVAGQTRKLTRLYARIEDIVDARQLHTALGMLSILDEETRCMQTGSVLRELVPDGTRLRRHITMQARRALQTWLNSVQHAHAVLGKYALHRVLAPAAARARPRVGAGGTSVVTDDAKVPGRPWTPTLTAQAPSTAASERMQSSRKLFLSARGMPRMSDAMPTGTVSASMSRVAVGANVRGRDDFGDVGPQTEPPMLYLRPLLQSALVYHELGLLSELRADYRRERQNQLQQIFDDAEGGESLDVEAARQRGSVGRDEIEFVDTDENLDVARARERGFRRVRRAEGMVEAVAGYFIVERAVEAAAVAPLLARSVVDGEIWTWTHSRVTEVLRVLETQQADDDEAPEGARETKHFHAAEASLRRFARAYGLPAF